MKKILQLIVLILSATAFLPAKAAVVLQPRTTFGINGDGSVRPYDVPCLTSTNQGSTTQLQRGMAYNPITGHVLVVDRSTAYSSSVCDVHVLDGETGAYIGKLDNNSTFGGGNAAFTLNLIGVADDGAIYVANLTTSTTSAPETRLYRWADEASPEVLVSPTGSFPADDPSSGNSNASQKRWGDTMTVRGAGTNTQILLANRGTLVCLYTPDDGTYAHFSPKTLTTDRGTGDLGYGLSFGAGDTFWGTSGANGNGPLLHLSFNSIAGTATTLTNFPSPGFPGTISPILVMTTSNMLAGITMVPGADIVRLYDISNSNAPVLLDRKSFITTSNNPVFSGALALGTNGVLYALDSDNGIMAFALTPAGSNPLPPDFYLNPASQTATAGTNVTLISAADSTLPITYQWKLFGTNVSSSATNASLAFSSVQLTNAGNYTVVATTTAGSVTSAVAVLTVTAVSSASVTWNLAAGGTWNSTASWNPATIPNGIGAAATFNNAASPFNPAQTGNSSVTLDGTKTVGSITFSNNAANAFTYTIATGTGGPLVFDDPSTNPATINFPAGAGTGNNTISVATRFDHNVAANVDNVTAISTAGACNLTTAITGSGGFTKNGLGLATFGTGTKTYTGPTVLNGGRLRMSLTAAATQTSSFTINAGGQLDLISAGTFTFGPGTLNLNGAGPTSGPYAPFPGAIRPDTGLAITINNAIVLQSDSLLHVQGLSSPAGSMTLPNTISGPGKLTFTSTPHDANLGTLTLNGANTYSGGTVVDGGTFVVSGANATLGTGNVTVNSSSLVFAGANAKLVIQSGVANAISDTATLSLAGGNVGGVADDGCIDLGAGINEVVGGLKLGGVSQPAGIYGSTASSATTQSDEYFSGTGIITVLPPPVTPSLKIASVAPSVVVTWPSNVTGFNLESATNLTPTIVWSPITNSVVVDGTNNSVTLTPNKAAQFFRLKQ